MSDGVNFMPIRLKIILMGNIKGKDNKISVVIHYLCSRNNFIDRSVKQLLNQHKRRGELDFKNS